MYNLQAENLVLKERRLNIAPAIRKQVNNFKWLPNLQIKMGY